MPDNVESIDILVDVTFQKDIKDALFVLWRNVPVGVIGR
jgi:hypothetical protein